MKKILLVAICVLTLTLGVAYILWQDGTKPNYGLIPFVLFDLTLAIGIIRRVIAARREGNIRQSLAPLRDAGTTYENLLLGRDQVAPVERIADVSTHLPEDPKA